MQQAYPAANRASGYRAHDGPLNRTASCQKRCERHRFTIRKVKSFCGNALRCGVCATNDAPTSGIVAALFAPVVRARRRVRRLGSQAMGRASIHWGAPSAALTSVGSNRPAPPEISELTARDLDGAVRFLSVGQLQFDRQLREFHEDRMQERRRAEGLRSSRQDYKIVEQDVLQIARGLYEEWPLGSPIGKVGLMWRIRLLRTQPFTAI